MTSHEMGAPEDYTVKDSSKATVDEGQHYRYEYKGIKLDPARICKIYHQSDLLLGAIVKKALCAGKRGQKSFEQDLKDIICAAERRLEMIKEDEAND